MNNGLRRFTFDVGSATQVFHPPEGIQRESIHHALRRDKHELEIHRGRGVDKVPLLQCHFKRKGNRLQLVCEEPKRLTPDDKKTIDWLVVDIAETGGGRKTVYRCVFGPERLKPNTKPKVVTVGFETKKKPAVPLNGILAEVPYFWPSRLILKHKLTGDMRLERSAKWPTRTKGNAILSDLKLEVKQVDRQNRKVVLSVSSRAVGDERAKATGISKESYYRRWMTKKTERNEKHGARTRLSAGIRDLHTKKGKAEKAKNEIRKKKLQERISAKEEERKTLDTEVVILDISLKNLQTRIDSAFADVENRLDAWSAVYNDNGQFEIVDPWGIKVMALQVRFQKCDPKKIKKIR